MANMGPYGGLHCHTSKGYMPAGYIAQSSVQAQTIVRTARRSTIRRVSLNSRSKNKIVSLIRQDGIDQSTSVEGIFEFTRV